MRFAAIIDSEPGWKAILLKNDGNSSEVDIKQWGIAFIVGAPVLVPLDSLTGQDVRQRPNFVRLINPNDAEG